MPTATTATIRGDHATFVEVILEAERPHEVRIEPRFEGPIWPPRVNGRAEEGWDERGLTTGIDAGRTAVGFAVPPGPVEGPVEIVRSDPIETGLPEGIEAWIDRVESRLGNAERLDRADDLRSAAEAIAAAGGLAAVERLAADIAVDRRLASRLSVVPDELRERLDAVEIRTAAFARIAAAANEFDDREQPGR